MARRQRDFIGGVLARRKAHLRVRRERHDFRGDRIWMRRYVVPQHQDRRLAAAHEIARHCANEVGASTVRTGQEGVDRRHREVVGPEGAQFPTQPFVML